MVASSPERAEFTNSRQYLSAGFDPKPLICAAIFLNSKKPAFCTMQMLLSLAYWYCIAGRQEHNY